jgi:ABC-type uncharacterized transport system involved in gliding motility auxiliary subunit
VTRTIEQPDSVSILALLESSDASWGETDFEALTRQEAAYDEGADLEGPLAMVMSVEAYGEDDSAVGTRLVVYGDSDFVANGNMSLGGNVNLFLNSVNWLAEEEELISIRPEAEVSREIILSAGQARFLQYSSVIFLPALMLLAGAVVWWRRR